MNCKKCETLNKKGSKFCTKCGAVLEEESYKQSSEIIDLFNYIKNFFLNPSETFKKESDKISNVKLSFIFVAFTSLIAVLANLIKTVFTYIIVTKTYLGNWETKTTIVWENIKDLNFIELIFKNFFIYALVIIVIASVFYLANLVIKKEMTFSKSLVIASAGIIPLILCSFIIAPILSVLYSPLAVVSLFGIVISISLTAFLYNEELKLLGNIKLIYNTICFMILVLIVYIILTNMLTNILNF